MWYNCVAVSDQKVFPISLPIFISRLPWKIRYSAGYGIHGIPVMEEKNKKTRKKNTVAGYFNC